MNKQDELKNALKTVFAIKHIDAMLKHFGGAIEKYQEQDWEAVCFKGGKFVEAVTKLLMVYCGKILPAMRSFKAGQELRNLEQLSSSNFSDTIRIVIPKGGIFIYEIVNNRGRHDVDEVDANEMDARLLIPGMSWILGELLRFSTKGTDPVQAMELIDSISSKTYPLFEDIDGRTYLNKNGLEPGSIALLILYFIYPKRIQRKELVDIVVRHNVKTNTANVAVHRLKSYIDENEQGWKLRLAGKIKAEDIIAKIRK